MKRKILRAAYVLLSLLTVVMIFAIGDYYTHLLRDAWSVPEYYFKNKIPYGFLWAIVGLLLARKARSPWTKGLIVSAVISITLQSRYFFEGYDPVFVFVFLLLHFIILLLPAAAMFYAFQKSAAPELPGQEKDGERLAVALTVATLVAGATYAIVFLHAADFPHGDEPAPAADTGAYPSYPSYPPASAEVKAEW